MDAWSFFNGVCLTIDSIIYGLVSVFFKIFMAVAGAELMTSEMYNNIANKVYMIIGVVMLFALAYGMVRAIINPEQAGAKGEMGGPRMIKAIVIAVIGLAITPVIFNLLFRAQNVFLKNDVIAAIFFNTDDASIYAGTVDLTPTGTSSTNNDGTTTGSATNATSGQSVDLGNVEYNREMKKIGGAVTATMVWRAFFRPNPEYDFGLDENGQPVKYENAPKYIVGDMKSVIASNMLGGIAACAVAGGLAALLAPFTLGASLIVGGAVLVGCGAYVIGSDIGRMNNAPEKITLEQAYNYSSATGDFTWYKAFANNISTSDTPKEINYTIFASALIGIFVAYAFLSFSIDMAIRAAKLAYCQMIAPVPIIMQIIPNFKDTLTKTFIPFVIKTFCEIFIRLSTVYIITYLICHLPDVVSFETLGKNVDLEWYEYAVSFVVLVLGLILFAKKIPDLLSSSLGIKTEGMGGLTPKAFREKLSDSRFMDAAGMLGAGATGLAQGIKRGIGRGKSGRGKVGHAALDGVRKSLGSMGRYARRQFLSGDATPAKSFKDARKALGSAVDETEDAMAKADARQKEAHDKARELARNNEQLQKRAEQVYKDEYTKQLNKGNVSAEEAKNKANEAKEKFLDAHASRIKASASVNFRPVKQAFQTWVGGTVDLTVEDTAIKLGGALADFNDNARNVAYNKGDATVKALKKSWDDWQNTSVGSYKSGYNDQTYNEELKNLQAISTEYNNYQAALAEKAAATANGTFNGKVHVGNKEVDFNDVQAAWDQARKDIIEKLDARTKWSSEELATNINAAKAAAEAAADVWVQDKLVEGNAEITGMAQSVVSEYASFIAKNGATKVVGKGGKEVTIASMISEAFGNDAVSKASINSQQIKNNGFVFDFTDDKGVNHKNNFRFENGKYVGLTFEKDQNGNYRTDQNGNYIEVETAYEPGDFFKMVNQTMSNSKVFKGAKLDSFTAAGIAKDIGKGVKQNEPNSLGYREKVTRKRQAESSKNGK